MRGILWHVAQKLEGILDGILMEFHMCISDNKNQIQKSMYIPWYLSSGFYSRPTGYSTAAIELMGFKKGIKREIAAYPSQKDERYFDGFKRSLFIVAKSHECNEVLEPT